MNTLSDIFIQEADENLQVLENRIISIEEDPSNRGILDEAFRAIHSIKGGAGLAGYPGIKDFTHVVEDLFENLRSGILAAEKEVISIVLEALDIIKAMVENIRAGEKELIDIEPEPVITRIKEILIEDNDRSQLAEPGDKKAGVDYYFISLEYFPEIFASGIDPLMFLSDLEKQGTVIYNFMDTGSFPEVGDFDPESLYLKWKLFYSTEAGIESIRDIFCFVMDESPIRIVKLDIHNEIPADFDINGKTIHNFIPRIVTERRSGDRRKGDRRKNPASGSSFIRVPTDKLENIFNTVSELLISQAQLNLLTETYDEEIPESFGYVSDSLNNITQLLQEQVTSLRMMSLGDTFDRFKRVVRDIASDRNKNINLLTGGRETELDKNMIEKLNDPLKHLVRNCIDHGIETEAERIAAGKPSEGVINLSAYLESGKVVLKISDDGRGIDKDKLFGKACDLGIYSPEDQLSDGEVLNLIFHPGLSTAEKITDLSGRGVGMDVVKNAIKDLNGNIDIISEKGIGTVFKIHLPLTMAILDGMLVNVGAEKYIIPTLSILEIFRPEDIHLKTISGGEECVYFRGDYIPVIRLHKMFSVENPQTDPEKAELIVINSDGIKAAILVDTVQDQYQIVLKSLQKNFRKVDHISSATILGDGSVGLIIDVQSMVHRSRIKVNA